MTRGMHWGHPTLHQTVHYGTVHAYGKFSMQSVLVEFLGSGALTEQAAGSHAQAGAELAANTQPFLQAQGFNPFDKCIGASAFQAAASGLAVAVGCPSPTNEPMPGTGHFKQAGSASTMQSSMTGTAFGWSEPATPTGVPLFLTLKSLNLLILMQRAAAWPVRSPASYDA